MWVDGATAARPPVSACLAAAVWMMCLIYAISGIRWYFALILLGASSIVVALVAYQATARWLIPAASGVMLLAALTEIVPFGAGPYLPVWALAVIRPPVDGNEGRPQLPGSRQRRARSAAVAQHLVGTRAGIMIPNVQCTTRAPPAFDLKALEGGSRRWVALLHPI